MANICGFMPAWDSTCRAEITIEEVACARHSALKCDICGSQARYENYVGRRACDNSECRREVFKNGGN